MKNNKIIFLYVFLVVFFGIQNFDKDSKSEIAFYKLDLSMTVCIISQLHEKTAI